MMALTSESSARSSTARSAPAALLPVSRTRTRIVAGRAGEASASSTPVASRMPWSDSSPKGA